MLAAEMGPVTGAAAVAAGAGAPAAGAAAARERVRACADLTLRLTCALAREAERRFEVFHLRPGDKDGHTRDGLGLADFVARPIRAPDAPYLFFIHGLLRCGKGHGGATASEAGCPAPWPALFARRDIVWANWDLRDPWLFDDARAWAADDGMA